jgi:hypothetical protein
VIPSTLRSAVDASLSWYDALCALHGVACGIEEDVWTAHSAPPPLHSAAKSVEPTARPDRALAALEAIGPGSIADSFGAFDLTAEGFRLLFEAQWIHRTAPSVPSRHLPSDWVIVGTEPELRAWTDHHDTATVLLPGLLHRSAFRIIGKRRDDDFAAGAVLHLCAGVVDISNVWTSAQDADWAETVDAAAALFPGRALVGYEQGTDLEHAVESGFVEVGPQRVWIR